MQFEIASYLYTIKLKVYKNIVKLTLSINLFQAPW